MNIEKRIKEYEKRLAALEELISRMVAVDKKPDGMESRRMAQGDIEKLKAIFEGTPTIAIDLTLPEAEIDGLFFNEQSVRAVFEKGDDGWYYSRDILFLSARNAVDDNSRDTLQRYLDDAGGDREIRAQIADMFDAPPTAIEIALPKKPQGIKKYHGVPCWYWLADPYAGSAASFCYSYPGGGAGTDYASAVGGCAPAFRVG
jgi:hypothetical protein